MEQYYTTEGHHPKLLTRLFSFNLPLLMLGMTEKWAVVILGKLCLQLQRDAVEALALI